MNEPTKAPAQPRSPHLHAWLSVWVKPLWLVMTLLATVALLLGGVWWGLHDENATARLLRVMPAVKVVEPKGALLGEFSARRVEISLPRGGVLVLIEPHWRGVVFRKDHSVAWQVGITIDHLSARSADLRWVASPPSKTPSAPPTDFTLPVSVRLGAVNLGSLRSNLLEPQALTDLDARIFLQESTEDVHQHQVVLNKLVVHGWQVNGGAALRTDQRMDLDLRLEAQHQPVAGHADIGDAQLHLAGPLQHLVATGKLQLGAGTEAAQSLTVSAEVAPFAAWPLPRLAVQAHGLNLAALWPSLPATALSGQASVQPKAAKGQAAAPDLSVEVALDNAKPGAWDAKGLPVVRLAGKADLPVALTGASAGQLSSLGQAGQLMVTLTLPRTAAKAPGTVVVGGNWDLVTPRNTRLQADIQALEPQALDGRAPPLQLNGRVEVQSAPMADKEKAWERWAVSADLKGQYSKGPGTLTHPVAVSLAGQVAPTLIEVGKLSLSSGTALAKLTGQASRTGESPWKARGQVDLANFDPQLWMPWPDKATGSNRLQGRVQFELDTLAQGEMAGRLEPSQLAGIPLEGRWNWNAPAGRPNMDIKAEIDVAGNRVGVTGTVPVSRSSENGVQLASNQALRGQLQIQAPAIQALQPLALWWGWRDLQGTAQGEVTVEGIWPALSTQGQLDLSRLQAREAASDTLYALEQVQGRWRINTAQLSAPADARLSLRQARLGGTNIEQLNLTLEGSAQAHRLAVQGEAVMVGSKQASGQAGPPMPGVHLDLAVTGGALQAFSGWKGQVRKLSLLTAEKFPRALLSFQDVDVQWASTKEESRLQVSPTRALVMGAGLRIQELSWREPKRVGAAGGESKVRIELDPIRLPELLARLQPDGGWGGDLMVVGQLAVDHNPQQPWHVDGYLARRDGDLSLSEVAVDGNTVQRLGIKQARVELKARDGVWTLLEQFEGRVLGVVNGRQVVRAASPDSLPSADSPLSGTLDVKIGNLRPWGVWAPPGWRFSGQVQAEAELSGSLGAPLYKGEVNGQNLGASHPLLGVNLTEGVLQLSLQGDHARLQQFKFKGGEQGGTVSVEGEAVLGALPDAQLNLVLDRFALLQRLDRHMLVSGQGQLVLGTEDIKAEGRFVVDEGLIDISKSDAPTIGDDVNVLNRPGDLPASEEQAEAAFAGPKRKVQVAIEVDLGSKLRLKGRGLETLLVGKLTLSTPNGRPAMHGTVKTESGTYTAYAQDLVIDRGSIAFTGPIDNPRLDILAMRAESPTAAASDVKVGVTITGTAQDPRVRLYSDPIMSETEKLSWLVLGRAPTGLGDADIGLLQVAASALLAGEKESQKHSMLGLIGLDDLSVHQTDDDTRATVINVGKQISRKWYLGYERSLSETMGNWQLIYRLAQRFTLRAQAGEDNALDLIWSWRFD